MEEIWKPIKGYEGLYEVSNLGRVRSLDRCVVYANGQVHIHRGKILRPGISNGYMQVHLCKCGDMKQPLVHRLVADAFIPNPENLPQVNHKDENPSNNEVSNLEWCTSEYNINYGTRKEKVMKSLVDSGYWKEDRVGFDKKTYYQIRRKDPEYRKRHNEYNRRYREKKRSVI